MNGFEEAEYNEGSFRTLAEATCTSSTTYKQILNSLISQLSNNDWDILQRNLGTVKLMVETASGNLTNYQLTSFTHSLTLSFAIAYVYTSAIPILSNRFSMQTDSNSTAFTYNASGFSELTNNVVGNGLKFIITY